MRGSGCPFLTPASSLGRVQIARKRVVVIYRIRGGGICSTQVDHRAKQAGGPPGAGKQVRPGGAHRRECGDQPGLA